MKKNKRFLALFLATAMVLQVPGLSTVHAAETDAVETVEKEIVTVPGVGDEIYTPNLKDDASLQSEFDLFRGPTKGAWTAADGVARVDGGNGNKAISKRQDFTDFAYEADITIEKQAEMSDQSSAQGGIVFRASKGVADQPDGYFGYYFGLNAKGDEVTLGRSSGNNWTSIATKRMTINYGETYHVTVTAVGSHITCYVDYNGENYAKIDVVDSTHTTGGIGMRNFISHTRYANLKVSEFTEATLEEGQSYTNPLLNMCADPDVLYHNGTYYLYPTNAGDANDDKGIKVYTSTDLVHWTDRGFALSKGDSWGTANFWAPDIIERDGVFYMYYVANEQLCVATSDSPLGPYKQDKFAPMDSSEKNIDAHIFYDEASEKYYIYYVRFTAGNVIWGAELDDDMKTIKKDTLTEIVRADQGWDQDMGNINEGPFMLVRDGKYYLTYSGSHFQSINYGSAYAVSDSPLGKYTKYTNNPIMKSNSLAHGTGHHGIAPSPDGTEMFMVYHSHHDLNNTEPRQLCIDRIQFTTDAEGNTVLEVKGPTVTPQALPSGAVNADNYIESEKVADIKLAANADKAAVEAALPAEVKIQTSISEKTASVNWDLADYTPQKDGEVLTVEGTIVLPEGVANLGNIDLTITANLLFGPGVVKKEIEKVLQTIEIPSADDIRGNITLPEEKDGVAFTWKSGNTSVITDEAQTQEDYYDIPAGVVTRQNKDTKVKLTVTGTKEGVTASREITVTVAAKPDNKDDAYVGYLYAHFKEFPGVKGEQDIFYGISKDGLHWTAMNDNEAVVKSTVGDKATRDPYIIRSAEGDKYYLIATDQNIYKYGDVRWDLLSTQGSTALTIWESTDLVNWTNQRNVDVAGSLEAGCAWAPEAIYDEATGEYLVYWASTLKADNYARQYTWVSRTRDFYTFTEPELFNDFGSNIDTSMLKVGEDEYYRLTKIENGMYVQLDKATGHLRSYGNQVTTKKIGGKTYNIVGNHYQYIKNTAADCMETFRNYYEGGTMFKFNDRDEWCIMLDEYGGATRGYIPFTTKDLDQPDSIKILPESEYMAQDGCKHGVMLPVTQKEYDALNKAYGVADGALAAAKQQEAPVAVYDFEHVSGDKVVPEGNKELVMNLLGNATVKEDADTKSKVLYLDGSEDTYAEFAKGTFDNFNNMTISMDVKVGFADKESMAFAVGQNRDKYFYVRVSNDEAAAGTTVRGILQEKKASVKHSGTVDKWVHVDATLDDHEFAFYVDGYKIDAKKIRNITELGKELTAYIGKSYLNGYFRGSVDNVKIYNRALTKEELGADEIVSYEKKLEAENAALTGKAKVTAHGAASGGKKVGFIDDTSSTVTFKLNAPKAGTYTIDIAADGDVGAFPNPSHKYWVNGDQASAETIFYDKSTSWDAWNLYEVEVALEEGENTFTLAHSGNPNSFAELDYILFYPEGKPAGLDASKVSVTAGGQKIDFAMDVASYEVDVEDLTKLPEISVTFKGDAKDVYSAEITQATPERPEAYIRLVSSNDMSYIKEYTVRFMGPDTFENAIINYGADPYVTYQDGYYYYVRVIPGDKSIWVTKSAELSRLGEVEPKKVYEPANGEPNREIWAPEIHFIDGKWYIYYTVGAGADHRMHVLESKTADAQGEYVFKGKMTPTTDRWAIDQTVFEHEGQLYGVWSGWDGFVDGEQRLYIAKMENPWTITGERVELSRPEFAWEINEYPRVEEGPQVVKAPDGTVNIIYSASGSWADSYCLAALTLKKGADPMDPDSWRKGSQPIFEQNRNTTFSTGHASFVTSPDLKEYYVVFHATKYSGERWEGRGVRVQRHYWNEDGTPFLGSASEYDARVNMPSGTKKVEYTRYEAEDAELDGVTVKSTYNSSAKNAVYGFTNENRVATFDFNVEKAGEYKLYIGASSGRDNTALLVTVNDDEFEKDIQSFNTTSGGQRVVDNWFGYELKVDLAKGANTVVVSGLRGDAALDYIELCDWDASETPNPAPPEEKPDPVEVDKTVLNAAIAAAAGKVESAYTAESWKAFANALANAQQVAADANADQETVNAAAEALETAIKGLVAAEAEKPDDNTNPDVTETLAKGDTITVNGVKYRVTNAAKKQAEAFAPAKKNAKTVVVANIVKVKGVNCKVTAISSNAFANMKKLTKVVIPKNVTVIGKKAFYKDGKLKSIKMSATSPKSVGKDAFKGILKKATIDVPNKKVKTYKKLFKKAKLSGSVIVK